MPITAYHSLTMTTPDNTAYENKPSDWNRQHLMTLSAVGSEIIGAFSNSNGLSFGTEAGGGITGSYTVPTQSAFVFSNSNGVSFGTNGSTVTATVATNYQSQGAYLTTAMASNRGSDFVAASAAFAGTSASGTIASNGISVSIGAYITTARRSTDAIGLNTAQTNVTWTANSSGISLNAGGYAGTGFTSTTTAGTAIVGTNNTAGLSVGVPNFITTAMQSNAATISNIKVSAGTLSANRSDLTFSNANGVTFGLETNGVITASAGTVAAGNITISAGTTDGQYAALSFANSNGVSFGLNGSTITASAAGGGATLSADIPWGAPPSTTALSAFFSTIFLQPYILQQNLTLTRADVLVRQATTISSAATNTTYRGTHSWGIAFYSYNGTNLTRASSASTTASFSYTSDDVSNLFSNIFQNMSMALNGSLTPGNWWIAFSHSSDARRSAGGGSSSTTLGLGHYRPAGISAYLSGDYGNWGGNSNITDKPFPFVGYWSSSNAFPVTIADSHVTYGSNNTLARFPAFGFRAI